MMNSIELVISFLTLSASISVLIAYPYDDHKYLVGTKPYPSMCCQLEWTNINQGENLPKDYVKAGTFLNCDWAYVGTKAGRLGIKSDQSSEAPNWLGFNSGKVNPYPILTKSKQMYHRMVHDTIQQGRKYRWILIGTFHEFMVTTNMVTLDAIKDHLYTCSWVRCGHPAH